MSQQPIPGIRFAFAKLEAGRSGIPYLALHPMGFSVPRRLRFARCALTAPFHPYHSKISNLKSEISNGGLIFCGTFRQKSLDFCPRVSQSNKLELRGIAPFGVRTFLPTLLEIAELNESSKNDHSAATFHLQQLKEGPGDPPPFQNRFNIECPLPSDKGTNSLTRCLDVRFAIDENLLDFRMAAGRHDGLNSKFSAWITRVLSNVVMFDAIVDMN